MEQVWLTKERCRVRKIPDSIYSRVNNLGSILDMPTTKAFKLQEKFLMGEFGVKSSRRKRNNGKEEIELVFEI